MPNIFRCLGRLLDYFLALVPNPHATTESFLLYASAVLYVVNSHAVVSEAIETCDNYLPSHGKQNAIIIHEIPTFLRQEFFFPLLIGVGTSGMIQICNTAATEICIDFT